MHSDFRSDRTFRRAHGLVGLWLLSALACGGAPASSDASLPVADAGAVVADAGAVTADAGQAIADAGHHDHDAGGLPSDTGVSPVDSSVAEPDAGAGITLTASVTPSSGPAGTEFRLNVRAMPFTFQNPTGVVVAGAGHYHIYFDGVPNPYAAGFTGTDVITSTTGDEGDHSITVYLVDGTHSPLVPRVEVTTQFHIE